MDDSKVLPFQTKPHDALRLGLPALKEDVAPKHPVEVIQEEASQKAHVSNLQMLSNVYGQALPLRMHIEQQILQRFQRLPGLPSSMLGHEILTGALEEFGFESYLGLPEYSEIIPPGIQEVMEAKLKMGTDPQTRGFV